MKGSSIYSIVSPFNSWSQCHLDWNILLRAFWWMLFTILYFTGIFISEISIP